MKYIHESHTNTKMSEKSNNLATSSASSNTRDRILDAAESLIIEHGFAATSLRAIAGEAAVNLAATHYHFGSKAGLLAAVFHRRMHPVSEARLSALTALEQEGGQLTVKAILQAFFQPLYCDDQGVLLEKLPSLIGRIHGEPESLTKPIMEQEFSQVADRFLFAIAAVLPDLPQDQLRWRFHFTVGSMIQLLRFHAPIGMPSSARTLTHGLDQLIEFASAGIEHRVEVSQA